MRYTKCPCEDCLCVPICRHKTYTELVKCSLINKYLIYPRCIKRPTNRIIEIFKLLQPSIWYYEIHNDNKNFIFDGIEKGEVPESG